MKYLRFVGRWNWRISNNGQLCRRVTIFLALPPQISTAMDGGHCCSELWTSAKFTVLLRNSSAYTRWQRFRNFVTYNSNCVQTRYSFRRHRRRWRWIFLVQRRGNAAALRHKRCTSLSVVLPPTPRNCPLRNRKRRRSTHLQPKHDHRHQRPGFNIWGGFSRLLKPGRTRSVAEQLGNGTNVGGFRPGR